MYNGTKRRIKTDMKEELFDIKRRIKQGNPLSPNLFCSVLEEIFRKMDWSNSGIRGGWGEMK